MSTSTSIQPCKPQSQSATRNRSQVIATTRIGAHISHYVLLAIATCTIRLIGLTHQSLWFDEGYTLTLVSAPSLHDFISRFAHLTSSEHLQPLYYLLMFAWSRIAGTSDFALRLPSALASIASCFLLYDVVLHIAPARRRLVALAVSMCFSLSSYSVFYAQDARPYALVQCLAFAVLASWVHRLYPSEGQHTRNDHLVRILSSRLLFVLIAVFACLTSVFNLLLVVALMVADGIVDDSAKEWHRIWLVPSFVGAGVVAVYIYFANRIMPTFISHDIVSIKQPLWMNIAYTLYSVIFGTSLAPADSLLRGASKMHMVLAAWTLLLPGTLALALALVAVIHLLRKRKQLSHLTTALIIATCIYAVGLFLGFGAFGRLNILPRHASSLFVLLAVLSASVMARMGEFAQRDRLGAKLLLGAVVAVVLCNVASLYRYRTAPDLRKDDYRAIAQHIPQDGLPTYLVEGQPLLLEHYGVPTLPAIEVPPTSLAAYLHSTSGERPVRLIVNQYRNYLWDDQPSPAARISSVYFCTQEQALSHMDVERCVPRITSVQEKARSVR